MTKIASLGFARALLLICLSALFLSAQSDGTYEITQSVIANGGGGSADASYAVEGTIGQFAAGSVSSDGIYGSHAGFWQSSLAPTAATVSISGRVVTAGGNPVRRSRVLIRSLQGDFVRTAITSSFGYYRIDGIQAGEYYQLEVIDKGFQFEPRILSVIDEIVDLDLIVFQVN